jgi:SNF2 family DNA or RNA helicase
MITPYPFQMECVDKVAKPTLAGRLVADDMGLGKTLEGILIDLELRAGRHYPGMGKTSPPYQRPTLIVAPQGVHDTWDEHIRLVHDSWTESIFERNIAIVDPKNRQALIDRLKQRPLPCFAIVHYEALRLIPELADIKWFHIICDEVHRVKNRKAQQTQALKRLDTFYRTGLSGTPADDKPADIWSVLNWLYPKEFRSYWKFVNTYCINEPTNGKYGNTFRKITGVNTAALPTLHKQWEPWYIRRKKEDVAIELPPKTYTTLHVDLLPQQRKAYDQMRKDMIAWVGDQEDTPLVAGQVVSQLVRLQQFALASVEFQGEYVSDVYRAGREEDRGIRRKVVLTDPSSKLDRLVELIEGNPNEPLVVFSQSRGMVELCVRRLQSKDVSIRPYTGSVSKADRSVAVKQFQAGDVQVLAGTIAAGGEGITLHRASTVVFLDRAWNPTRNRQAEDRLHRIGQLRPVQVIDFVARDTVDMGRLQRVANKWENLLWLLGDKRGTPAPEFDTITQAILGG